MPTDGVDETVSPERGHPISVRSLFTMALTRLRSIPSAALALVIAGVIISGIDWLQLHDPIPTVGFSGVQEGDFSISYGIVITILSRANVPLSALVDLKTQWLAWAIGLEALGLLVIIGAGAFALARLLNVPLTSTAVIRYAVVVTLFQVATGDIQFEGGSAVLFVPVAILLFVLAVHLFPLPGLLIAGYPIRSALRQSWDLVAGNGWTLFGVIVVVGGLNHLLASIPIIGAMGSALAGVLHAGTVAVFLREMDLTE
ncbi:hypothetical protein [Haladaptatus halobius]|uniref:hypothetical protein n=1 Tax=Haladaptatus halobius TaxID=2884875 RepID=UPI001D09C7CE|nr:hypothetical protein [Haladaptatus halobius]